MHAFFSSLVITLKHSYNIEAPHYKQHYNLHEEIGALTLRIDNTDRGLFVIPTFLREGIPRLPIQGNREGREKENGGGTVQKAGQQGTSYCHKADLRCTHSAPFFPSAFGVDGLYDLRSASLRWDDCRVPPSSPSLLPLLPALLRRTRVVGARRLTQGTTTNNLLQSRTHVQSICA